MESRKCPVSLFLMNLRYASLASNFRMSLQMSLQLQATVAFFIATLSKKLEKKKEILIYDVFNKI